ncbi:unnamed protein product [Brassica oleracea]
MISSSYASLLRAGQNIFSGSKWSDGLLVKFQILVE